MSRAHEDLQYAVEEWEADDSRVIEVLARVGSLSIAYAAYWAALAARPKSRIVLRQKAHQLAARDAPSAGNFRQGPRQRCRRSFLL